MKVLLLQLGPVSRSKTPETVNFIGWVANEKLIGKFCECNESDSVVARTCTTVKLKNLGWQRVRERERERLEGKQRGIPVNSHGSHKEPANLFIITPRKWYIYHTKATISPALYPEETDPGSTVNAFHATFPRKCVRGLSRIVFSLRSRAAPAIFLSAVLPFLSVSLGRYRTSFLSPR